MKRLSAPLFWLPGFVWNLSFFGFPLLCYFHEQFKRSSRIYRQHRYLTPALYGYTFLQGIDTQILSVLNLDRSRRWYTEQPGLPCTYEDPKQMLVVLETFGTNSLTIWETARNNCILPTDQDLSHIQDRRSGRSPPRTGGRGVSIGKLILEHEVTHFSLYDPHNNLMEVCQVRKG